MTEAKFKFESKEDMVLAVSSFFDNWDDSTDKPKTSKIGTFVFIEEFQETGEVDSFGANLLEPSGIWCVDLLSESVPESLKQFQIFPVTPSHSFWN